MTVTHRIKCNCRNKECSNVSRCAFLPTDFYPLAGCLTILFVGQGGGKTERIETRPFCGAAGNRLKQIIGYLPPFGYALSNTIRDCPPNNRVPFQFELDLCLNLLFRDIKYLKLAFGLRAIVPLGSAAKDALIDDYRPISKIRGQIYYSIEYEYIFL